MLSLLFLLPKPWPVIVKVPACSLLKDFASTLCTFLFACIAAGSLAYNKEKKNSQVAIMQDDVRCARMDRGVPSNIGLAVGQAVITTEWTAMLLVKEGFFDGKKLPTRMGYGATTIRASPGK
jgi:hypothetical protein